MLGNLFSIRQFKLIKWSFLIHSTKRNAPYIHPGHDLILKLCQSFLNVAKGLGSLLYGYVFVKQELSARYEHYLYKYKFMLKPLRYAKL